MPKASSGKRLPHFFSQLWQLPDSIRWMDPLPPFHRRGIIFIIAMVLLAFLWPSPTPEPPLRPVNTGSTGGTDLPLQAEITDRPAQSPPAAQQPVASPDSQGQWRSYQIASGQTLAQLFRDNNLPVNDVFAMAQVEGTDKPLSNLQTGQRVKIRQNMQGIITGLTVDGSSGQVLFTRQPDGTFLRAQ